jgi:hypothetical protein
MSSIQSPPEKKKIAYEKDHYAKGESDKARKSWPNKKRKSSRRFRHAAQTLTQAAAMDGESDEKISAIKQRQLLKWGVSSLGNHVANRLAARQTRIGAKKARQGAV